MKKTNNGNTPLPLTLRSGGPKSCTTDDAQDMAYDPAQIGWFGPGVRDDIDPLDPLAPLPEGDALVQAGFVLRPWRREDLPQFLGLLDDPRVWTHLPESYPAPLTQALAASLIVASAQSTRHTVRAVVRDGEVVGQVRLDRAGDKTGREVEISYWLGTEHWGHGIGGILVPAAVARAFFNDPDLRQIVARVRGENVASRRILESAGFANLIKATGRAAGWLWLGRRRHPRAGTSNDESP